MATDANLQTCTCRAGSFRIISAWSRFEIVRNCTAFDRCSAPSKSISTVSASVIRSDGNAAWRAPGCQARHTGSDFRARGLFRARR
ncbi:MAG: hypothetical protein CMP09_00540 [Yangia sp.]|nr:hypothetical protein [Salipiger sp.]